LDDWITRVDVLLERIAANHAAARAEVGDIFLAFRQAAEKAGESTEALAGPCASLLASLDNTFSHMAAAAMQIKGMLQDVAEARIDGTTLGDVMAELHKATLADTIAEALAAGGTAEA